MSFIGTLLVSRPRPRQGLGARIAGTAGEPFQHRGDWLVSFLPAELVGEEARPQLTKLARGTGGPVLSAFVFESDCALVSGLTDPNDFWSACLVRDVVADLDELTADDMIHRYGTPSQATDHARTWSLAAGLRPDRDALLAAFAFEDSPEIFLGLKLVDQLLSALGLPEAEETPFYQ